MPTFDNRAFPELHFWIPSKLGVVFIGCLFKGSEIEQALLRLSWLSARCTSLALTLREICKLTPLRYQRGLWKSPLSLSVQGVTLTYTYGKICGNSLNLAEIILLYHLLFLDSKLIISKNHCMQPSKSFESLTSSRGAIQNVKPSSSLSSLHSLPHNEKGILHKRGRVEDLAYFLHRPNNGKWRRHQ